MSSGCLHENDVQALLAGALPDARVERVESHLDACLKCQLLVSAGVRSASLCTHGLHGAAASRVQLSAGDVVSGRYEITRFIARGGMGEVYAAHDRMLDEEIALKVLLGPAPVGSSAFASFKAEVQLARRVTDPHVLRVFDLGSYLAPDGSELLFLTMQLLRGETLRERVRRAGPLPPAEAWRLAGDMFAALGAAHEMGIVHSDFKSDNVMLVPTVDGPPGAVVMDFGLAQAVATNAPRREGGRPLVAGTLGYMAPEQIAGGAVTPAADVYAFGVVLHEMLTGVLPPFRPTVARQGGAPPPRPLRLDTLDIPARWRALIRRCLARDPSARFPSILDARDAAIAAGYGARRRAILVAAGAAVLPVAIVAALWRRASAGPPAREATRGSPPPPPPLPAPVLGRGTLPVAHAREPEEVVRVAPDPRPDLDELRRRTHSHARRRSGARPVRGEREAPPAAASLDAGMAEAATGTSLSPRSIADTDDAMDPFREKR